jgi:hypothetical protein
MKYKIANPCRRIRNTPLATQPGTLSKAIPENWGKISFSRHGLKMLRNLQYI